ncbi:sugar transferase, partial [Listeria seeligeri]
SMSLIGPRPEIVAITSCYSDKQKQRLMVKPGITGWAQVNGRSDINNGEKIRLDLEYIEKQTAMLDSVIFFKTVWLVLAGKGSV